MEDLLRTDDFVAFESRNHVFDEIMDALRDETVSIIGICGMGGIGKTKLVMETGKKAKDEGLFDNVVMRMASQDPDIRRMQGILADMLSDLSLGFKGASEADRAAELSERLKKERRVLIILDDVWEKLNVADIGIPSRLDHKGCKLVLTTRRAQVCDDMCCQRMFHLNVLNDSEALDLFSKHARIGIDGNSKRHSKAKGVVKECGGLPLAIETVGSALRNKSLVDYDDAIRKLSRSEYADIESVDREIYPAIKLSFDYLNCEETVDCLTLFSLYPEDREVDLEDFTRIAFGLGLFENVNSVEEARQNTLRCVTRLLDACLLSSNGTLKGWNSFQQTYEAWNRALVNYCMFPYVKVHDIVRDVALWLSRKDKIFYMQKSPSKTQSKEYEDAIAISMKDCGLNCLLPNRLKCPKLKLLLVETGISGLQGGCFEMMSALQVLKLNVVGGFDIGTFVEKKLPTSIQHLHSLCTFLVNSFHFSWSPEEHLSVIGRLKNLQILSLPWAHISELPQEIAELTRLRLLDLSQCRELNKIPRNVLSSLTALEELYICRKFEVEKDLFLEITSLPHLTALTARVNCFEGLPTVSFRQPLRRYTIHDSGDDCCFYLLQGSRNVTIAVVDGSDMASLQRLFPRVEYLHIRRLQGTLENLFPGCFDDLTLLEIGACDLDCLIDTTTTCQPTPLFSNLQHLQLRGMTRMTRLCKGPPPPGCLQNIRNVVMHNCLTLENVAPHVLPIGPKLEYLCVVDVSIMKHVFDFDPQHLQHVKNEMSLLPCPQELRLGKLHQLTAIWKWPHQRETLDLTKNDSHEELCNLIPEAMFRSLNSLVRLEIFKCEVVEEVFQLIHYNDQKYKEQLSNLIKLRLLDLPRLRYIWRGPHQNLHLHKLERIELVDCRKITSIFTAASARSLHKLRFIKISECEALESIISLEEDEFSTSAASLLMVVSIPELEVIYISSCGELKSILPVSVLAQGLPKLEVISISDCAKLEQVFGDRAETLTNRADEIAIYNLYKLKLVNLPSLVHISTTKCCLICPSLRELKAKRCPLLGTNFRPGQALDGCAHRKQQTLNNQILEGQSMEYCQGIGQTALLLQNFVSLHSVELTDVHEEKELFDYSGMIIDQEYQPLCSPLGSLKLQSLTALNQIWRGPIHSVQLLYLRHLSIEECPNLRTLFTSTVAGALKKLEKIEISNCNNMETILVMGNGQSMDHELDSSELPFFPALQEINIKRCIKLKSVLPLSVAQELPELQSLKIKTCPVLQNVFSADGGEHGDHGNLHEIKLPSLRSLNLAKVPTSMLFTSANLLVSCPNLQDLFFEGIGASEPTHVTLRFHDTSVAEPSTLKGTDASDINDVCQRFADIRIIEPTLVLNELPVLKCIWKGRTNVIRMTCLCHIEVRNCAGLKSLFTRSIAQRLRFLETIVICNCEELEYIIEPTDHNVEGEEESFSAEVTYLVRLWKIKVEGCERLKFFFPLSVAQRLPSLHQILVKGARQLEQVIGHDQRKGYAKNKEIVLPHLRILKLEDLPRLSRIFPTGYSLSRSSVAKLMEVFITNCNIEEGFDLRGELNSSSHEPQALDLEELYLANLSNLKYMWKGSINPCHLHRIVVRNCPALEYIFEPRDQKDEHGQGSHLSCSSASTGLRNLSKIEVEECERIKFIFPLSIAQRLPSLTEMSIKGARQLEQLFCDDERRGCAEDKEIELPKLRTLKLEHLFSLSHIIPAGYIISSLCFSKLRAVFIKSCGIEHACSVYQLHYLTHLDIIECPNLRTLFTSTVARALKTLKKIKIKNCQSLDTIFALGEGHAVGEFDLIEPACFSTLQQIEIEGCHKLKSVIPFSAAQKSTKLKKIEIKNCQNLEAILAMGEGHSIDEFEFLKPTCLRTLQETETEGCHKLKSVLPELRILTLEDLPCLSRIFPANYGLSRLLVSKLQKVFVKNCNIEEVFNLREGLDGSSHEPKAQNLEELYLLNLPNLKYIWAGSVNLKHEQRGHSSCASVLTGLPKLRIIEVQECERLTSIFPLSVARQLPSLKKMSIKRAHQLGQLFSDNPREGCAEGKEIVVPELRILELEDLPCLSHILPAGHVISSLSCSKLRRVFIKDSGIEEVFDCTVECRGLYQGPVFANLTVLYLCHLPNLKHIWKVAYPCSFMGFNRLKCLHVEGCERLTTIFPRDQYFPTLEIVHVEGAVNLQSVFDSPFPLWTIWLRVPQLKTVQLSHLPSGVLSNRQSAHVSDASASYIEIAEDNNLFDLEGQVDVDVRAALEAYTEVKRRESDDFHHRHHLELVEHKTQ